MCKGIRTDDRLVRLHRITRDAGNQLGRCHDLSRVNARVQIEHIAARFHRHDDLFQRGIAGTFSQAIDGAFDLARAVHHGRKGIGHGQAQIIVAMGRPDYLV